MDIWRRFEEVTLYVTQTRRFYRSSAPNYEGQDNSQRLTNAAVEFLRHPHRRISAIISFNEFSYTPAELTLLRNAGINYLHLSVPDFRTPSLEQLRSAFDFVWRQSAGSGILIHCGYGHGRTGTGVTGIQLQYTLGNSPSEQCWTRLNHVETPEQLAVLRRLRDSFNDEL